MRSSSVLLSLGFVAWSLLTPGAAAQRARHTPFTDCSEEEITKLRQAKDYLREIKRSLRDDFEIRARRGQERRAERQIDRRLKKLRFKCKERNTCSRSTAVHSFVGGNTVRICYSSAWSFCRLTEIVAHEFGHIAHIPRDRWGQHSARGKKDPDQVYQFGYFAADLCLEDLQPQDFDLPRPENPRQLDSAPLAPPARRPAGPPPTTGILLYPRSDYRGRGRLFVPRNDGHDYHNIRGFTYWNDLRFIGRHDAFTSARVLSGFWELCDKRGWGGRCVYLEADVPDFRAIDFNNKTSSLRHLGDHPTVGAFLYRGREYTRGAVYVPEAGIADLAPHGLAGKVSSVRILRGLWEGCERPNYVGWCHSFTGENPDLSHYQFEDRIHSFRRQTGPRIDGLTLHRKVALKGGGRYLPAGRAYPDLGAADLRVNDSASSLIVLGGEWEVCAKRNFGQPCRRVRGVVRDLKSLNLDDKISSVRKVGG